MSLVLKAAPLRPSGRLLDIDPSQFRACFNRRPFLIGHSLTEHPLFALPRLIELACRLPESFVEYYAGEVPRSIDWQKTPRTGLSIEETIRRIEHCCSWMVLKRVDEDPEYRMLLHRCLDEIEALSEPLDPGMRDRAGAIFISSPGAVTPYHMDVEYNFLVQVRGAKAFHVYPGDDRSVVSERELEEHLARNSPDRNLVFLDRYVERDRAFELSPGFALHVPSLHPHWVQNGPAVSISFSLGFLTRSSSEKTATHVFNHHLRKLGVRPRPQGQSRGRDRAKQLCLAMLQRAQSWWPGAVAP